MEKQIEIEVAWGITSDANMTSVAGAFDTRQEAEQAARKEPWPYLIRWEWPLRDGDIEALEEDEEMDIWKYELIHLPDEMKF